MNGSGEAATIRWGADGLVPVVTVDADGGDVLMVASMNAEALARTRETGVVHYWSRSRNQLWRKGETSGHEQRLVEIRVNCNRDSLLLRVDQRGAVCHDGYPSCYYRTLALDGSLAVVRERVFDPAIVYGANGAAAAAAGNAAESDGGDAIALWYGAYLALRDGDHSAVSCTSRLLRAAEDLVSWRLADELDELAGVLDGSHRHGAFADDVALEATQCLYWAALLAVRGGIAPEPFKRLLSEAQSVDMSHPADIAAAVAATADSVRAAGADAQALPRVFGLVAAAASVANLSAVDLVMRDIAQMRDRPYLTAYFAGAAAP